MSDQNTPYSLSGPALQPASGKDPKQIIVLLHGYGANGDDLIGLAEQWKQELPDALFISPHAPHDCSMGMGKEWFPLVTRDPDERWNGVQSAAPVLNNYLDKLLEKYRLEDNQLAIVGFSQGAMMTLHVGLRRKKSPAALISYSGMLAGAEYLKGETTVAPPILMVHGDQDDIIPVKALLFSRAALEDAGQTVLSHIMQGVGHGIDPQSIELGGEFLAGAFGLKFLSEKDN